MFDAIQGEQLVATIVYALVGMGFFGVAFLLFGYLSPFSVRKEIEEDQNVALGVIMGAFLVGLAIIIASAMH